MTIATSELSRIDAAVEQVRAQAGGPAPTIGVVLGSGLGSFADGLTDACRIPFAEIPGFPKSSVIGHAGMLVLGTSRGIRTAVMAGRVHGYEGYSPQEVVFPIRVLARLGIQALVVTNASGCINREWVPGDLMRIEDHLNFTGRNPLIGPNDERLGPRFPDMAHAYDPRLSRALDAAAASIGMVLRRGVYAGVLGPSYETPAEIRMLRTLGADAVGMSTVLEVIAAAHAGIPVAGVSCLTNMAAGILEQPLTHAEVTATAARVRDRFVALLEALLPVALEALRPSGAAQGA
jgi:purine-nucleoside phosphorylase